MTTRTSRTSSKRAAGELPASPPSTPKRARKVVLPPTPETPSGAQIDEALVLRTPSPAPALAQHVPPEDAPGMVVHMPLGFDFDDARKHLTAADPRFGPLFAKLRCKPFEELETREAGMVNPFRSLASSILGQQISWLAARSITHKFLRIYTPSLPEKYDALAPPSPWPTPAQVLATPMTRLREAGLSGRKAEYILDLAARFSDGRLDPTKLIAMSDEEVMEHLVAVRGIGRWTVEMFQIFTLRRPDVMPAGDLGIQRGLVRWYTTANPGLEARKLKTDGRAIVPLAALATPPATPGTSVTTEEETVFDLPPLPPSGTLTPAKLRGRLTQKIKGNIYLSPIEMEELTAHWRPFRSIGVWYLWSLTDGGDASV